MKRLLVSFIFCFSCLFVSAQNTRTSNYNSIGWYNYFGTFNVSKRIGIHTEYQFRRTDIFSNWQQSLLRLGVNYQINSKLQFRLGYGWIETFPYGDIPLNSMGKQFTEHRIFQAATINDKIGNVDISHRFMLEQRWVGRYSDINLTTEDEYVYMGRARYMLRLQRSIAKKELVDNTFYAALYDELFIGFGENVNENIFDQNRIGLVFGYRFNKSVRLEAGYLNQTLQLGREVAGSNVFQHNNGLIVNAVFNFNFYN